MSTSVTKSRSPVERSYSSASSTTSSRRSGRRKRRRMKHTVMPLKKRTGRHEVPCDVHRVSNLDHEEMEQSACFWVAKNIDNPSERSFKEDVFVNKDQDSLDDEMSYLDERPQSQTSGEFTHETRYDEKYVNKETRYDTHYAEKENNAKYANEDGEKNDGNYSEEKTFYGVRKGKTKDGNDLDRVSPIPSPRNRSRISSFSDDGHSGFSSEGTGMHVGWTSDVGVSSGPEYSAMTDESDGEGGVKRTRRGSKEFYGYRKKTGEKTEYPTRKFREADDDDDEEEGVVLATDVTATKTTEVESFQDNYESKNYYESKRKENVEIDREFYTKEEIERSQYTAYNGRSVAPGTDPREEFEPRVSEPQHYEPSERVNDGDFEPPINDRGEFEPQISDPRYDEPSGYVVHGKEGLLPGAKTSTPSGHVHPSSDTELVNFRSFEIDVDRYSDRSLPLGGHKTKTQYYSVEDLIRSANEETNVEANVETSTATNVEANVETNVEKADSGSDGPEVPRVGEYEKYVPPRDTREDEPVILAARADDQESQPNSLDNDRPRVIPSTYNVNTQRPLLLPRGDKMSPRDKRPEMDEHSGTYEDSKEFYGYRRSDIKNEYESKNEENVSPRYGKQKDDPMKDEDTSRQSDIGRDSVGSTKDREDYKTTEASKVFDDGDQRREFPKDNREQRDDDRTYEESKQFYGYRQSKTGAEPQDDVRQRYGETKSSGDQPKDRKWEETKEFFGYRSKTGSKENLLDGDDRAPQWQHNQEFYRYRESKTGNDLARGEEDKNQRSGSTTKTRTVKESREFYGFRSFGSSENISKGGRDGQVWEESKQFYGFRRKQVVDGQAGFADSRNQEGPQLLQQRAVNGKPLYLQSADDKRREELLKESRDVDRRDDSEKKYEKHPYGKQPYEKHPFNQRPYEKQPYGKQPYEKQPHKTEPTKQKTPLEKRPDEIITQSTEQDNLMAVDFDKKFEESKEFHGYRRPEELPRSAAYEQYERPKSRSENIPPPRDESDRITTRGYEVNSTRYTERQTRETKVTEYKNQTSEPEIKNTRVDDVFMQPEDAPEDYRTNGDYDHKYEPTRPRDSTDNYDPREKHMFNILEIPSSKKVIPLVSDIAPNMETNQTTTTETTTTKRLHTRSQRDTLRREAKQPEPTEPEGSDVGMKMFRQRSLPRKHGHPVSSDEKSKELPRKITKKTDEPDLSQVDPDFANKFREIMEKRKKKTTTTTETTTKSAAESCDKNVEELVNVFNTLEHIQKTADKKNDRTIQPGQVKKIVKGEALVKPAEKENNLSPATSVSQKLNEIENILDSVDKNRQRGARSKPEDNETQDREGRDTRPSTRKTRETYTTRETRETREERETRETRRKWKPRTPDDLISKQEEMPVESFPEDERDEAAEQPRPWTYKDTSPYKPDRRSRRYDRTRSRDDDDEIYRAQIKKSREKSWRDTRTTRKKKYDSKSDGEIDGFKSTPFGDRVITPGTAVNIKLYGLNLQKIDQDRPENLNWEMFTGSEVPVNESVGRTQVQKQPFEVEQFPGEKMPVDESIDRTEIKKQPLDVQQMPGDEPRMREPTIDRSHVKPTDLPQFPDQHDEPRMKDLSMREQQEPLYRRQERLPRKRDAPLARPDSLDDDKVTSEKVLWSHPPVSKVRPEKKPGSKVPAAERPQEELSSEKTPEKELPFEHPSESYPWKDRPYEKSPYEKRPLGKRSYKRQPSDESLGDTEIPVEKVQNTEDYEEPDARVIDIEYTDDDEDDNKLAEQGNLPGQNTLYEKSTLRSSTPKGKSPSDDIPDQDSSYMTHEESTERHESTSRESGEGVDTTIHTTRTTKTTRTETTETTVKKIRKSGSDSTLERSTKRQPEDSTPGVDEPDFKVPVRNEPEVFAEPEYSTPQGSQPEPGDEPSLVATEFIVVNNDTGRPINLTMLGRLEENDDDYLSSQSREDLFLHTRLKMVTENKNKRTSPEEAHLLKPNTTDQDDVDNEGSLTSSDEEFESEDIPTSNVTEQLLIPISGEIKENIDRKNQQRYVFPTDDGFEPQTRVHEPVFRTDQPAREDITRDSFGNVFIPRTPHEPDLEREHAATRALPDFESIPGFKEPVSENIGFSEKPGVVLEFGEPVKDEELDDIEIIELPLFNDFSVESMPADDNIPSEKTPIDEEFSKERTATPTLPELKHEPIDENITSEQHDKNLNIPDIPDSKPVEPVDETIEPCTQISRDVYIPDLEEVLPEIRRPTTPTPVDETITAEQRENEVDLPHFTNTRPSQPVDEDIIQSEPIRKQVYVPDLQEFIPETKKPVLPVDENVMSERREIQMDIPELQVAEPERRASEPITEEISADEPIKSEVFIPDFAVEFQEVLPEFPESTTNEDRDVSASDEGKDVELPGFQEAEQEPHQNDTYDKDTYEKDTYDKDTYEKDTYDKDTYDKDTYDKETYDKDTYEDETWSETHKTVRETTTTETVTVEKTVKKYVSDIPQRQDEPVSPRSPRKERAVSPRAVPFISSLEPKDSGESSSEPSPRSSETPGRKRRSRRGNRFDSLKRSGPLVPESVVKDESPVSNDRGNYLPTSNVPRVVSPIVPEREQPVSNIPESKIPFFTPREKTGQMRPEMYLLDSDDDDQGGDVNKPDEEVVAELFVPVEKEETLEVENVPEDECPVDRDELSPELIDELLEKEVQGLEDESQETSEEEPEVMEIISKEEKKQPELENMPDETPEIEEIVLAEEIPNKDDTPSEITEEIEESLSKDQPRFSDEEDGNLPQEEEVEKANERERSPTLDEELEEIDEEISRTLDERVPRDAVLPETAREEPPEDSVPEEVPEKSGGENVLDFEVILIEHLEKDDVAEKSDDEASEKSDDESDREGDNVINEQRDSPGEVTTEEESTVETVIVEKTHSEITMTEITTTRYPTSPQDTPSSPNEIPKETSNEDEDDYVIIPIGVAKPDEIVKPSEVETVEGSPEDLTTTNDEQPTTPNEKSIPLLIVTKEPKRQLTSDSESDKESSNSSTTDTDDERTDSDINKVVSTDTMTETPSQPTETVFGIVEIKYEKAQNEEILIVEKTIESSVEIREIPEISEKTPDDDSKDEVLIVVLPENVPTEEDGPTHEDVPTVSNETPKEDSSPLELDIAVVPVDEESSSSSDEEPSEDKRGPGGTSETTVETLIIEKTSTQISTTITKITASSDESHDSESDSEVPVTVVAEDAPTTEALPKPQDQSPDEETPELDIEIVIAPADDESTTSSDTESTSEKDTEADQVPEEQEIPADDKPTTSSSESSSDDEKESKDTSEISTVETIIVEKTQVSTTITEITTNNAPDYPTNDSNYPAYVPNYPASVEEVATTEDIPKTEYTPTFAEYPMDDDLPTTESVPKAEMPVYEGAPISDESEGLVYEVSPVGKSKDTDEVVPDETIDIPTNEQESQTEYRDVLCETTQTETTTETRDAYSMTPARLSSDSEIQTQIPQGSASTQTSYEEDSQWYRYTRTVEEVRESSEKVTGISRQLSDSSTQTDRPVDDDLRVLATNQEGTQTELDGEFSESEVTRITRRTTTETRTESSYSEQSERQSSRDDINNDCPVCLQSLEATNYSFIKVKDASRFVAMEENSSQYEMQETTSHSACFACGRDGITWEASGYSSTMTEDRDERASRRDGQRYISMDIADGYSGTARGDLGYEGSRSGEGSGRSSTMMYESGQDEFTREGHGFSSTTRKEWSYEKSTRETSEQSSRTCQEWQQDLVIESESSSELPEGAHFSIRIDGDEKCLLYCRRTGHHSCALQKLASIIQAQRKAATSSNQAATMQAQSSESLEEANEESEEQIEAGTSDVIGPLRCDVSVQTDGALLPADFEVFNEKDFEIYYDAQKSPRWTAMTIAQGMQKEHESLMKQLDMLREVNQKLRDQKDAIQAAHEAQCAHNVSLWDELALAQTLESSPVKEHKVVTRQGSEMSKYFGTFEGNSGGMRQDSRLESVTEAKDSPLRTTPSKKKLTRTKGSVESFQPTGSVTDDILEYASSTDGVELETERVFEDGELTEAQIPEWMEKIHQVTAPKMSEAEKQKTEREFRKQKANIASQLTTQNGQYQTLQTSDEEDGGRAKIPLSPRTSPAGTDAEVPTEEQKRSLSLPSESNIQRVYKVVFVGDSGVGKSSFIHRYCYEIWKPSYTATIGVDFQVKPVQLGLKKLALQLWDTAGQERFRSITKQYFRKADGVVLLYDLSSEPSFINIKSWMTSVEEAAEPGCTVMLIGNKLDLCEEDQKCRAVAFKHAEELAEEYGCLYAEASAKSGENVNEAMETLAKRLLEQEDWQLHSVLNLKLHEEKKKSKCCGRS